MESYNMWLFVSGFFHKQNALRFIYVIACISTSFLFMTVMVNFMCQLHWAKNAQMAGKHDFWLRVFPENISIWIISLSKENPTLPVWVGIIQSPEGLNRTKRQRKENFFSSWAGIYILFCPLTLELLVLGPLDSGTSISCHFLQLADRRLWVFLASITM